MKKFAFVLLAACLSAATASFAQENPRGVCGMSAADQKMLEPFLLENLKTANSQSAAARGAIKYVPIHFHLVGDGQAEGKIREQRVLDQLCDLNAAYLSTEIQFYLSPHPQFGLFNYSINNDNVFSTQTNSFLMTNKRHAKALNVYVVKEAVSGNNLPGGGTTLAYYNIPNDWIVSRKDQISGVGNGTLAHEVGHFFTLKHTFHGWDSNPFDPTDIGWPKAPSISPDGVPTEKVDATNCTTAGDFICDTPPDYNFGYIQSGCALYNGGAKDPMGVLVNPMENNFMSYFLNCADYMFTTKQKEVMNADLNSSRRNYLDNTFSPVAQTITAPADMITAPIAGSVTDVYNEVNLEWKPVTGATYYLVELDVTSQYATGNYQSFILTGTSKLLTNLKKNQQYYWRVRPFNEFYTCAAPKAGSFKTSLVSGVPEIAGVKGWTLQPNPAQGAENVQVVVDADRSFEANVTVSDAAGKQVVVLNGQKFAPGQTAVELSTERLAGGVYFVTMHSGDAVLTRKLVVVK